MLDQGIIHDANGAAEAAVLALRHGSKARKIAIPFAPFLAFGAIVALFAGDAILDWYLGIFG